MCDTWTERVQGGMATVCSIDNGELQRLRQALGRGGHYDGLVYET